jgi:hypothetical protein
MQIAKLIASLGAVSLAAMASCGSSFAVDSTNFTFAMVSASSGVEGCLAKAAGRVTITHTVKLVENMHVEISGLPANTDFDLFVIQVPTSPFGLSWYMGDMLTDATGVAVGDFIGRFSFGTFLVAPGVAQAPVTQTGDASSNPVTAPIQLYHLGVWFDSTAAAAKAGCSDKQTPFNSTHNAGIQALNTSNFATLKGPLINVSQ